MDTLQGQTLCFVQKYFNFSCWNLKGSSHHMLVWSTSTNQIAFPTNLIWNKWHLEFVIGSCFNHFSLRFYSFFLSKSRLLYRLISFWSILEIVFLMFVKTKPDHDVQLGLNRPTFWTITTLSWKLKYATTIWIVLTDWNTHAQCLKCGQSPTTIYPLLCYKLIA